MAKEKKIALDELKKNGYYLKNSTGGHDIYRNDEKKYNIPLKRGKFTESDLRYILKEIERGGR